MAVTVAELRRRVSARAHTKLGQGTNTDKVNDALHAGLEMFENANTWRYLRKTTTLALVADDYSYTWPSDIYKFDKNSFRYGGAGSYLQYIAQPEELDHHLGPQWRDTATASGSPYLITDMGREFWIAPKPSAAFVASNPTVYFYGWQSDLELWDDGATPSDTATLLLPRNYIRAVEEAALSSLLQVEDDPDWKNFDQIATRRIADIRGNQPEIAADEAMNKPDFGRYMRY